MELTPEQQARIEANRKQALERRQKAEAGAKPNPKARTQGSKLSRGYYEYNLSTMRDTKAGFLEEEEPAAKLPEKKRKIIEDIPLGPLDDDLKCIECGSLDLDVMYLKMLKVKVCKKCIENVPDKYSLLTKTEAKQDYLLTDGELRDRSLFPVWEKANPHKSTWNNMLLYLRRDLEEYAAKKWGGLDGLDREFERREEEKQARKEKKYQRSVADLRRRTRADEWEKERRERLRLENEHEHEFEDTEQTGAQKCRTCGLEIEVEEF
ncbi:DNA repair protein rad14 [Coemansia sp. RSA 1250]|nr:DNA repair protein rad14 [Coemansia sp. RSA 1250]